MAAAVSGCATAGGGAGPKPRSATAGPPAQRPVLTAGRAQTCLLDDDDRLGCWGHAAADAPNGERFVTVAVGPHAACAVDAERRVRCWGSQAAALSKAPDAPLSQLAIGDGFACGLHAEDGTVRCWGSRGEVIADAPRGGGFVAITAGRGHACALDPRGAAECFGDNDRRQCDPLDGPFMALSAGGKHTCGVLDSGRVVCWGDDRAEQSTPPVGDFVAVSAGLQHSCALGAQGIARCWGEDSERQATPPNGRMFTLAAGDVHGCAIEHPSGRVRCWGNDFNGEASPPRKHARTRVPKRAARPPRRHRPVPRRTSTAASDEPAGVDAGVSYGKVIVLGLRSEDGDDAEAGALSMSLRSAQAAVPGYTVGDERVTADQMALAHGCQGFDVPCMKRVADRLGAAALVFGTLRRVRPGSNARIIVELRLFEALSGEISATTTDLVASENLRMPGVKRQAAALLRRLREAGQTH